MKKRKALALLFLCILFLSSCGGNRSCVTDADGNRLFYYTAAEEGPFDTVSLLVGYARSEKAFRAFAGEFFSLLWEYHRLYDIYHSYDGMNNLKTVNDRAGEEPIPVDERIFSLLKFGLSIGEASGWRTDITYGSVLSVWHQYREAGKEVPSASLLESAALHTGADKLLLDEQAGTVAFTDPLFSLDVGAIAKGYATEAVCSEMERRGYTAFSANIGGNICAVGTQADGTLWTGGIQNPAKDKAGENVFPLVFADTAIATSGDYQRYYTVDGVRYHHIIDPVTNYPGAYWCSVSVIAPDAGLADALSTALFNLPYDDGIRLLTLYPGSEAVWIDAHGVLRTSPGISAYRGGDEHS